MMPQVCSSAAQPRRVSLVVHGDIRFGAKWQWTPGTCTMWRSTMAPSCHRPTTMEVNEAQWRGSRVCRPPRPGTAPASLRLATLISPHRASKMDGKGPPTWPKYQLCGFGRILTLASFKPLCQSSRLPHSPRSGTGHPQLLWPSVHDLRPRVEGLGPIKTRN